jgi:hypothetical protein
MKAAAVTFLVLLLLLQARAQAAELMLLCQKERKWEYDLFKKINKNSETTGTFSATVLMQTHGDGKSISVIDASTWGCGHFVGYFTEIRVVGECDNEISPMKYHSVLGIDRISGEFELSMVIQSTPDTYPSMLTYYGQCKPDKKMF